MYSKKLPLCFCLLLHMFFSEAQGNMNYHNVLPPTPEVASFAKNVDIPMSYSSGTPQIGIPFHTIVSGSLQVPISLGYNASGIRVEEASTRVGLGWNLSTGPTLTRSKRGLADESSAGYMNSTPNFKARYVDSINNACIQQQIVSVGCCQLDGTYTICDVTNVLIPDNMIDLEPDIFSFSAMGYSGKFYWNQDSAKFIMAPFQNIKIEYTVTYYSPFYAFSAFVLTLPNGVKCNFGGDVSYQERLETGTSLSIVNGDPSPQVAENLCVSSWAIKQIEDPAGRVIKYNYSLLHSLEYGRGTEKLVPATSTGSNLFGSSGKTQAYYKNQYAKPMLQSIIGENTAIYFKDGAVRTDAIGVTTDQPRSLDSIIIKDRLGKELKSFSLYFGYFNSGDSIALPHIFECGGVYARRLRLDSVVERNFSASVSLPPYKFTYNTDYNLPNRLSSSQDYWGYYNGKANGNFLLPIFGSIVGADRRISTPHAQAGILTKVSYPTGGSTSYYYESNDAPLVFYDSLGGVQMPDVIDQTRTFMPLMPFLPPNTTYPEHYYDTFSVTKPVTKVRIHPSFPTPCNVTNEVAACRYEIRILRASDNVQLYSFKTTAQVDMELPEGNYIIDGVYTNLNDSVPNFGLTTLSWGEHPDPNNFLVGGLRVKHIVSLDGAGKTISRHFTYREADLPTTSSAVLAGSPVHLTFVDYPLTTTPFSLVRQYMFSSNSSVPLTSDGQTVRYTWVGEYYDSAGTSFKTLYNYYSDFNIGKLGNYFGTPLKTCEWQNNVLRRKITMEKIGNNNYRPTTEEFINYQPLNAQNYFAGLNGVQLKSYEVASEWFLPLTATSTAYSYEGGTQHTVTNTVNHFYNNNFMENLTRSTNSKGKVIDSRTWYPNDYNVSAGTNIAALQAAHIQAVPVKQETSINGKLVSGSTINYNEYGLPIDVYAYENNALLDTASNNPSTIVGAGYVLKANISYDSHRNIEQVVGSAGDRTSYIWHNQLDNTLAPIHDAPAAKVQNADAVSIAYTSFEEGYTTGGWTVSNITVNLGGITGKSYHNNNNLNISKGSLSNAQTYIVSYWSNQSSAYTIAGTQSGWPILLQTVNINGNTWKCFQHSVTGQSTITVTGSGGIDELRLYPKAAQMVTYTYTPLLGISSQCDVNNKITYYEYDSFNRLKLIKDQDGKVIKVYDYQYQVPPTQ